VVFVPFVRLTASDREIARLAKSDRTSYRTELRSESSCARDVQGRATWGRPPCSRTFADSTATYPQDTFAQVRAAAECLGGRLIHVSLDTPAGYMRAPVTDVSAGLGPFEYVVAGEGFEPSKLSRWIFGRRAANPVTPQTT